MLYSLFPSFPEFSVDLEMVGFRKAPTFATRFESDCYSKFLDKVVQYHIT